MVTTEAQVVTLLTVPDVARVLRVSERTAWTLVKTGRIASVRIGRSVRVRLEAVTDFTTRRHGESARLRLMRAQLERLEREAAEGGKP